VPLRWVGDSYPAGVPALMDATAAITMGHCNTVLVVGGQSRTRVPGSVIAYTRPDNEFTGAYGSYTSAQFALVAQRYFHKFKADPVKMAEIAAGIRNMGSIRPGATLFGRGPFTAETIMASPMVVEPFHLLELCLASEGAAAFIVTSLERARDCPKKPIRVLGGGMEYRRQQYVDPPIYEEVWNLGSDAFARASAMAGIKATDLDVFQLYDANAWEIARQFEAIGLCKEGEGLDYITQRGVGVAPGQLPINTDGGLMSFGHIGWSGPTLKAVESVRQLRGEAATSQAKDAKLAIFGGAGSGAQYFNLAILGRD
jgi:acetyl-CoA acetyltransferase